MSVTLVLLGTPTHRRITGAPPSPTTRGQLTSFFLWSIHAHTGTHRLWSIHVHTGTHRLWSESTTSQAWDHSGLRGVHSQPFSFACLLREDGHLQKTSGFRFLFLSWEAILKDTASVSRALFIPNTSILNLSASEVTHLKGLTWTTEIGEQKKRVREARGGKAARWAGSSLQLSQNLKEKLTGD